VSEAPRFHIFHPESANNEIIQDLLSLPNRFVLEAVLSLLRLAKQIRCHAAIMAYIKSQLPVFNRQPKQDQLVCDLPQNIETIASKYNIPIADFAYLNIDPRALREFDFNKIRKLRDNSLSLISELIESDIPKILSVVPHTEQDLLILAGRPVTSQVFSRQPPRIADYIDDFNSLNPDNGSISGSASVRDHLVSKSGGLPSASLHKIWKLADFDSDGRLTLPEYAVARDLIEFIRSSKSDIKTLPKKLPPSYFPS
jgi:hypothetical protein